jgi:hypothetical protein
MNSSLATRAWELEGNPRFELRRRLGAGGFGAVFEVLDRERGARVALKLLERLEGEDIYRFKQEFRALAEIAHPNLVHLYELLGDGVRWFFTMELVEGASALSYVRAGHVDAGGPTSGFAETAGAPLVAAPRRAGPGFDEARLRSVLVQLVAGLSALHDAGKMHRDVKSSNVLVARDGRVVIVDFGLAARLSASGELSRSTLIGTPEYLAPELVLGEPATAASDWYGVGALLFEALTGQAPFTGSVQAILAQKVARSAPAPSALVPGVPPDLDRLCAQLLSRDPAARPGGAALRERVGAAEAPRSGSRVIPFVGRVAERAALAELFRAVREDGVAAVALVGGVSGIGKSALVNRACAEIRDRAPGAVLLVSRCWEQESVPYKAIDGLVDPLSRHLKALPARLAAELLPRDVRTLARLFPVLEQVEAIAHAPAAPVPAFDAQARRRAAFRALRDLLGRLARDRPLVLVIDDLQWGDPDSGALLLDLLAPPDPPPLLLVVSYRSDEVETSGCLRAALPALRAMSGPSVRVASIELDVLGEVEATALARALLPEGLAAGDEVAASVAREAGRRPFFIQELAEASRERARDGQGPGMEPAVTLDALVRARTAELPDAARRLLEVVAVAGRPVERAAAARAADLGDEEPAAYGALLRARLVRGREVERWHEIETYHDRIRATVASGLTPARRAEAFLRLAEALDGTGRSDAETVADYFVEGGRPERAVGLSRQAAEEAVGHLAFERAVRLYRRALDLCPAGDPRAPALREGLADALVVAGRGAEAAAALALAAATAPPDRSFELRRRAAEQYLFAGHVDEGMAALRRCLADVGLSLPESAARRALGAAWGIVYLALRGFRFRARSAAHQDPVALRRVDTFHGAARAFSTTDTVLAVYLTTRTVRYALAAGEPRRALEALGLFSGFVMVVGGALAGLTRRLSASIEALVTQLGDARARAVLDLIAANRAMQDGEPRAARAPLQAAAEVVRGLQVGASWEVNIVHELTCMQLHWSGAWAELAATLARMLEEARDQGNQHLVRSLSNWFGHVPALLADDPEGAARVHAEAHAGWWPAELCALDHFSFLSRADIALYADRGAGPGAHRLVAELWSRLERSGTQRLEAFAKHSLDLRARAALAFAASAQASPAERAAALADAERTARRLRRMGSPLARAFAELTFAGLAQARGEAADAARRYQGAEAAFTRLGCAHYAAAARRRRGALLGGAEGRALVAAVDAWFAAEGARDPGRIAAMLAPGPAME